MERGISIVMHTMVGVDRVGQRACFSLDLHLYKGVNDSTVSQSILQLILYFLRFNH